ncbi:MAG: lamin tail domain-containing protein [Deltaproteobacteria bacterium]|nr:lamin tail domain-containing protein [Deltaproteobacteria bacterium]MCW5806123.1 lamin tail domain-containing protein [Deltaproteobacteria bacterium]
MRSLFVSGGVVALAAAACGPSNGGGGACKDDLLPGDLVITEVLADYAGPPGGSGADAGKEWFEIYNASGRPLELEGLKVTHSRPDGSKAKSHTMGKVTIDPGQYLVLGNSVADLLPPYVDYGYSADLGDLFNTDGGKLRMACGDAEIDAATYEAVRAGHSRQLSAASPPDYTFNDIAANWCEAKETQYEPNNFGTPGQDNDCVPVVAGACNDNGTMREIVPPKEGELVITEIMAKPTAVSATVGQWFEVKALADVDLNGLGLDRANDNNIAPEVLTSPNCMRVTAGSYVVFARSSDPLMNGGLTTAGTFKFTLNPTTVTPDVRLLHGATIIDAVTWTTSTSGASLSLDPDFTEATANDDPANFCNGTAPYNMSGASTDRGTPGAANPKCALVPQAGQCIANGVLRAVVKPAAGQLVITEFLANPAGTGTDATQEWFEITNTGATAFDVNGLGLKGNAAGINVVQSAECKSVAPGGFALFAHTIDPLQNGGLPDVDGTFTFALAQSNGSITVLDGATPLDAITWTTGILDGVSKQLDPNKTNTTDNDVPANFCNAKAAQQYNPEIANFGTPKAVNACL